MKLLRELKVELPQGSFVDRGAILETFWDISSRKALQYRWISFQDESTSSELYSDTFDGEFGDRNQ